MKAFKKIACSFMALTMVIGLTACAPKTFEHKKLTDFLDDLDFDSCDEPEDFYADYGTIIASGRGDNLEGSYIHCEGRDAQEIYDTVFNRFNDYKDYDVEEATAFCLRDETGLGIGYLLTFEETKDAEKIFKKFAKDYIDDGEKGEEKTYSYYIEADTSVTSKEIYGGIYIRGNTVLIIRTLGVDSDFADDFAEVFGVISPTEG